MLRAGHSSRRAAVLAAALVLACERGGCGTRGEAAAESPPTVAQRDGRTPVERSPGLEESRRADRHRRAAARAVAVRKIEGTLERNADGRVTIRSPGEESVVLKIGAATAITLDGRPAPLASLRPGARVRASYESGRGERRPALTIDARSPPRTHRGVAEGRGPDVPGGTGGE